MGEVCHAGGRILSLASCPDGKAIYGAASGQIRAISAHDGEPRKIIEGDAVAAHGSGRT